MRQITVCEKCPCLTNIGDFTDGECNLGSKVKYSKIGAIGLGFISTNCKMDYIEFKDGTKYIPKVRK